jgi:hypothetical protein
MVGYPRVSRSARTGHSAGHRRPKVTRSRSRLLEAFSSKADPQTGLNQSSYLFTEKSLDDAQQLEGTVGLRDVVVATGRAGFLLIPLHRE